MSRKGFAIGLMLWALTTAAGAEPGALPEAERQQILAPLAGEAPPERLSSATVFLSGDLPAVQLAPAADDPAVYILERSGDNDWRAVARIRAPAEGHFGDAVLLSPSAILVASPDTAGAGLGPGATYVFQRNVGGTDRWGLVAKLAPDAYPPTGAITVEPRSERGAGEALAATVAVPPPVAAAPPAEAAPPIAAAPQDLLYIAVANMKERPRALALTASLRVKGYASEAHRNRQGFFVVTLARLPAAEARRQRDAAVAAGDVPRDAYLIVGRGFEERISP